LGYGRSSSIVLRETKSRRTRISGFYNRKEKKVEKSAPNMAYLRVMLAIINGVGEKEVLLDSGSQIVLTTKKVTVINKVIWDPNLSIQIQSANRSCHNLTK